MKFAPLIFLAFLFLLMFLLSLLGGFSAPWDVIHQFFPGHG